MDLSDDWRELGQAYLDMADSVNNVFFDFHALVAFMFGGQKEAATKLISAIEEQVCYYSS